MSNNFLITIINTLPIEYTGYCDKEAKYNTYNFYKRFHDIYLKNDPTNPRAAVLAPSMVAARATCSKNGTLSFSCCVC